MLSRISSVPHCLQNNLSLLAEMLFSASLALTSQLFLFDSSVLKATIKVEIRGEKRKLRKKYVLNRLPFFLAHKPGINANKIQHKKTSKYNGFSS